MLSNLRSAFEAAMQQHRWLLDFVPETQIEHLVSLGELATSD